MASLVARDGSQFWYIQTKTSGRWRRDRTTYRIASTAETRKAQKLAAQLTLTEKAQRGTVAEMNWDHWVVPYLNLRYELRKRSLARLLNGWTSIRFFLREKGINIPCEVRREDCLNYIAWRQERHTGLYRAARNTAIYEVKLLGLVLGEAYNRGWIMQNPCRSLGISRAPAKVKPEITPEEEAKIRLALEKEPRWMQVCFDLAMATGCRLGETSVPWTDVDLDRRQISFIQKGNRVHSTLLPDWIIPRLETERSRGAPLTVALPPGPSKWWCQFFARIGLPHLSFHSTRVTVVSRLARAGVSERISMRYVGHASATVHRIYQRLAPSDLTPCLVALGQVTTQARGYGEAAHSAKEVSVAVDVGSAAG